jgi:hypothetical protein
MVILPLRVDSAAATAALSGVTAELNQIVGAEARATASLGKMAQAQGVAAGSSGNLARQLGDVATMAAMGMSPMQIAITQGEQLAFALKEAGGASAVLSTTMGASIAVLVGLAAQLGAVYLAWDAYATVANEANAANQVTARGMERLLPLTSDLRDSIIDLREATGDLTAAQADMERAAVGAFTAYQNATRDTVAEISKLRAAQGSVTTQMVDTIGGAGRGFLEFFGAEGLADYAPGAVLFDALTTSSEELQGQIDAGNGVLAEAREKTEQLTAAQQLAIQADADEKVSKDAVRVSTAALSAEKKRLAEAERREAEEWKALQDAMRAEVAAARKERELEQAGIEAYWDARTRAIDVSALVVDSVEAEALALADLALAYSRAQISAEQYAQAASDVQQGASDARVYGAAEGVGKYSSTNGVLTAVSSAGPWGALIAAIVDLVANLDDTIDSFHDLIGSFLTQIGKLPETIVGELQYLITEIPQQVGEALGSFIGSLASVLDDLILTILDPRTWIKVLTGLIDGILNGLGIKSDLTGKVDRVPEESTSDYEASGKGGFVQGRTSRTTSARGYGRRPMSIPSPASLGTAGAAGLIASLGSSGGRLTLTIAEQEFAQQMNGLKRRGVVT